MVSLDKLSCVTEECVTFSHPNTGEKMKLRPEDSINIRTVVEKVKSLPQTVKDYFDSKDDRENQGEFGLANIKFTSYLT